MKSDKLSTLTVVDIESIWTEEIADKIAIDVVSPCLVQHVFIRVQSVDIRESPTSKLKNRKNVISTCVTGVISIEFRRVIQVYGRLQSTVLVL